MGMEETPRIESTIKTSAGSTKEQQVHSNTNDTHKKLQQPARLPALHETTCCTFIRGIVLLLSSRFFIAHLQRPPQVVHETLSNTSCQRESRNWS